MGLLSGTAFNPDCRAFNYIFIQQTAPQTISAITLCPVLIKLKKVLGGFHLESGMPLVLMIPTILVPTVSILFIVVMMIIVTKGGNQQIYLFENGLQTYGTLIKKVKIDLHDATIYRVTFEYEVNGQKYKMWEDISSMARLEDDEKEPILYNPKNPKKEYYWTDYRRILLLTIRAT